MGDALEEQRAHGDVDHRLGHVEAPLVVSDKTAPTDHPADGTFDDPPARDDLEACRRVGATDDLDDEVEECGLVHQLHPVVARIGEEVLQPRPALADGGEDRLRAFAVRHVCRGEVHHQQSAVGVHGDVALAPDDPLAPVEAAHFGERRLHRLAVEHAARGACLASRRLAVEHERHIVDGAEQ